MSTGSSRHSSGFTLFELVIVLILLGLFSTILVSRLGEFLTDGDLRTASRSVIHEIQRSRAEAAHSRLDFYLGLDMDRNTLYEVDSKGNPVADRRSVKGTSSVLTGRPLPMGVRLEDVVVVDRGKRQEGVAWIRFSPDGSSERALIHLRNEDDVVHTLRLNPLTGSVRVYEKYVDEKAE